jgi:hypothetical protein
MFGACRAIALRVIIAVRHVRFSPERPGMNLLECYRMMEVDPGASLDEVHRSYKRLAMKHHPDHSPDNAGSHRIFCRLTEAYAKIEASFSNGTTLRMSDCCERCGDMVELFKARDGRRCCAACLLATRHKRLTMPAPQTVRCLLTVCFELVAMLCLIVALTDASILAAVLGMLSLLAALSALSYDVLTSAIVAR